MNARANQTYIRRPFAVVFVVVLLISLCAAGIPASADSARSGPAQAAGNGDQWLQAEVTDTPLPTMAPTETESPTPTSVPTDTLTLTPSDTPTETPAVTPTPTEKVIPPAGRSVKSTRKGMQSFAQQASATPDIPVECTGGAKFMAETTGGEGIAGVGLKKLDPDIIHSQMIGMGVPALAAKKLFGKPYIVWGRGSDVYLSRKPEKLIFKPVIKNADAVIALTQQMKEKIGEYYKRDAFVIPNGINLDEYNNLSKKNLRTALKIGQDDKVIIYVCREWSRQFPTLRILLRNCC